jgi:hypothetical protein
MGRWENFADDDFVLFAVRGEDACVSVFKIGEKLENVLRPIEQDLAALVTEALALSVQKSPCFTS